MAKPLNEALLSAKKEQAAAVIQESFLSYFETLSLSGKNLLQEEVLRVYVDRQIRSDLDWVKSNKALKKTCSLLYLEKELSAELKIRVAEQELTVVIKGKADRIDREGETLRIVDYKSSVSSKDRFAFVDFQELFEAPSSHKKLQLLLYAWLSYRSGLAPAEHIQPCILAFKGADSEPLFIKKDKEILRFSPTFFSAFEEALAHFVARIFDPAEDFQQTDDENRCEYCAFNTLCLRD